MIIYFEYIIINNFIIDYLLFMLLQITKNEKYGKNNIFFALCIAICVSFIFPYLYNYKALLFIFKVASLAIVIMPLKRYRDFKDFAYTYMYIMLYSFLFGGVMFGLINMLDIRYTISGFFIKDFEFPSGVFIAIVSTILYFIVSLIKHILDYKKISVNSYDILLNFANKNYALKGYLDSGNFSKYKDHGIIYISKKIYVDMLDIKAINNMAYECTVLNTINDKRDVNIFYLDKLIIKDKVYKNIPCAVSNICFKDFDCLLQSDYV